MERTRYHVLDCIRGFAIVNMVIYHCRWDLVHLFGFEWRESTGVYIWQQSICWTFILISGFSYGLGRRQFKRGLQVFLCGILMTVATGLFTPQNQITFGVLTLIGSCMLLMIPANKLFEKFNPVAGMIVSGILFAVTRNINQGFLGFEKWNLFQLPNNLYHSLLGTYLGFKKEEFFSPDYFSLIPWMFLFAFGYFMHKFFVRKNLLKYLEASWIRMFEWVGRNSLVIYVFHQPVMYVFLNMIF